MHLATYLADGFIAQSLQSVDGITWTLVSEVDTTTQENGDSIWTGRLFAVNAAGRALVGNTGPFGAFGPEVDGAGVIGRTEDSGVTWTKSVPDDFLVPDNETDLWESVNFLRLPTKIWALGKFVAHGETHYILESTDEGLTFTPFATPPADFFRLRTGVYLSEHNRIVLAGDYNDEDNQYAAVSDDGGATWTYSQMPGGNTVHMLAHELDVIVGVGMNNTGARAAIWRSTDAATTWTEMSASVEDIDASNNTGSRAILALGGGRWVLTLDGRPNGNLFPTRIGGSIFRVSADNAATFQTSGVGSGFAEDDPYTTEQMAVADDGAVLVAAGPFIGEIWRGVDNAGEWTWTKVFTASDLYTGCGFNITNQGPLLAAPDAVGRPDFCVAITGGGCVTEVPADPAIVLSPLSGPAGFLSALFLLGLGSGSFAPGVPAVMQRPAGCSPLVPAYCPAPVS